MAKLTTKGTTILARWRKTWETPADDLVSERTREYAVRSSGVILQRNAARFRSDTGHHDWGWKVYGKAHAGYTGLEDYIRRLGEQLEAKGFQRESS